MFQKVLLYVLCRDEKHYLERRHLKGDDKWQNSDLIRKLVRCDGITILENTERIPN